MKAALRYTSFLPLVIMRHEQQKALPSSSQPSNTRREDATGILDPSSNELRDFIVEYPITGKRRVVEYEEVIIPASETHAPPDEDEPGHVVRAADPTLLSAWQQPATVLRGYLQMYRQTVWVRAPQYKERNSVAQGNFYHTGHVVRTIEPALARSILDRFVARYPMTGKSCSFLYRLPTELRLQIYSHLSEQNHVIYLLDPKSHGALHALYNTCHKTRAEIRDWYAHARSWVMRYHCHGLEFRGGFNPRLTTFYLDFSEVIGREDRDQPLFYLEWLLGIGRVAGIQNFCLDRINRKNVRHLIIDLRVSRETLINPRLLCISELFRGHLTGFSYVEGLESVVLVFSPDQVADYSINDWFYYELWMTFWTESSWCAPGRCCNCCVLPELRVCVSSQSKEDIAMSEANGVPLSAPLPPDREDTEMAGFWYSYPFLVPPASWEFYASHPMHQIDEWTGQRRSHFDLA